MVVIFGEDGYWIDREEEAGYTPDSDDKWVHTGWRVRTYEGQVLIKSKERGPCLEYLHDNGFTVCADGEHYERELPGRYAFNGNEHSLEAFDDDKFERGE